MPLDQLIDRGVRPRGATLVDLGEQSRARLIGELLGVRPSRNRFDKVVLLLRYGVDTRVRPHPR